MIGFYNYTVILTYLGLACSTAGILFALNGRIELAVAGLMLSGLCDMFDGAVARTRKRTDQEKRFGIQIDSLQDMVCFGILPAVIGYCLGMTTWYYIVVLILYPIAAMIRLAYFNVTEEDRQAQTTEKRRSYEGLPVTNAAIIFPFVFSLRKMLSVGQLTAVYALVMLLTAVAFLYRFKLKKPGLTGIFVLLGIGIVVFFLAYIGVEI